MSRFCQQLFPFLLPCFISIFLPLILFVISNQNLSRGSSRLARSLCLFSASNGEEARRSGETRHTNLSERLRLGIGRPRTPALCGGNGDHLVDAQLSQHKDSSVIPWLRRANHGSGCLDYRLVPRKPQYGVSGSRISNFLGSSEHASVCQGTSEKSCDECSNSQS